MTMSLKGRMIRRLAVGLAVAAAMLFLPAGSLRYWQGWVFLVVLMGVWVVLSSWLMKHSPDLMERRLQTKEKEPAQKVFQLLLTLIFFLALTLPGFDFRYGWSRAWIGPMPWWVSVAGQAAVLAGSGLTFWVMWVNRFASRTIQVEAGQSVICSGPYAVVRHPMYSGIAVMMLAVPLALGSYVALPVFALTIPLYVFRLIHEEGVLRRDLPGYPEYCERTRFRLVPGVW